MVDDVKVVSPSLLLLEDDADVAITIAELLEERGFVVTVVADAAAALQALDTSAFSLVLADFLIGKLADSEATALRVLDAAGPTPVGAVTAWRIPETLAGRYAFIRQKPFAIEEFLETVALFTVPQVEREAVMAMTLRYFAALNARDWSALGRLCTDGVTYHVPGDDKLSVRIVGRADLERHAEVAFSAFPGSQFEVERMAWLLRGAIAHFKSTWTSPQGTLSTWSGAVMLTFEGERISEIGIRMDTRRLRLLDAP